MISCSESYTLPEFVPVILDAAIKKENCQEVLKLIALVCRTLGKVSVVSILSRLRFCTGFCSRDKISTKSRDTVQHTCKVLKLPAPCNFSAYMLVHVREYDPVNLAFASDGTRHSALYSMGDT